MGLAAMPPGDLAHAGLPACTARTAQYPFCLPSMGILDDAIREHLELKRQRGATAAELKPVEEEAGSEDAESEPGSEEGAAPPDEEQRHPAEEEPGDDDVLADTPDFLKDAPEDDELWFEQGEPKDFDF